MFDTVSGCILSEYEFWCLKKKYKQNYFIIITYIKLMYRSTLSQCQLLEQNHTILSQRKLTQWQLAFIWHWWNEFWISNCVKITPPMFVFTVLQPSLLLIANTRIAEFSLLFPIEDIFTLSFSTILMFDVKVTTLSVGFYYARQPLKLNY